MPIVYLVRHAQASFGATDYDQLSDRGQAQVQALSRELRRRRVAPDRVISGSLRRQRDTAASCGEPVAGAAEIDSGWDEFDSDGVLSYYAATDVRLEHRTEAEPRPVSTQDFQAVLDEALERWIGAGVATGVPQSWPAFRTSAHQALSRTVDGLGPGQTAVVFTSSGVIAALAASLIGLPDESFIPLNRVSVNTALSKLIVGRRGMTLVSYNEHAHLDEAGPGMLTYR